MHATIAAWDGNRPTLWDKTQWVYNVADEIAAVFGISAENIRVMSPFVGGAFGSRLRAWPLTARSSVISVGDPNPSDGPPCDPYTVRQLAALIAHLSVTVSPTITWR